MYMATYKRKTAMTSRKVYRRKPRKAPKKSLLGVKHIRELVHEVIGKNIETKEVQRGNSGLTAFYHNGVTLLADSAGNPLNSFHMGNGAQDPMERNTGNRVGDEINVRDVTFKMFIKNGNYGLITYM